MRYCFDIDGTICTQSKRDYEHEVAPTNHPYDKAVPWKKRIEKINKLYDEGHTIIYWTARGTVTKIDWIELTRQQLYDWGCKCHDVRVGKPQYDLWIDDKSMRIEEV